MNNLHTPGPWMLTERTIYALNEQGANRFHASVRDNYAPTYELNANARLMAAAPELLDALEKIKLRLEVYLDDERDMAESSMQLCLDYAQQAIAKARGEQC